MRRIVAAASERGISLALQTAGNNVTEDFHRGLIACRMEIADDSIVEHRDWGFVPIDVQIAADEVAGTDSIGGRTNLQRDCSPKRAGRPGQ